MCLEQSRGALINALLVHEFIRIHPLPPSRLAQYRQAMTSSGAKSDVADADLALDFLEKHRHQVPEWKPDDELTRIGPRAVALASWIVTRALHALHPAAVVLPDGGLRYPPPKDILDP